MPVLITLIKSRKVHWELHVWAGSDYDVSAVHMVSKVRVYTMYPHVPFNFRSF